MFPCLIKQYRCLIFQIDRKRTIDPFSNFYSKIELVCLTIHTEKLVLCYTEFSTKIHWNTRLAASDVFICLHNQLSSFHCIIAQMSEKRVHQIDSKSSPSHTWLIILIRFITLKNNWINPCMKTEGKWIQ